MTGSSAAVGLHEISETVQFTWDIKIPLRDGMSLSAIKYSPKKQQCPGPCLVTLTPYTAQLWHHFAVYFAEHGYSFLSVDCRGRGNSEGEFYPFFQEAHDGYDVVEWVARQPYCSGQVAMWGGSYSGYSQWATASQFPPHLATIVPVASVYPGLDFPMRKNVGSPYALQWLTFVAGRTLQERVFLDEQAFWSRKFRDWFIAGTPFNTLDEVFGMPSDVFQEWVAHPRQGPYWDRYNPSPAEYAKLAIPILTITGIYDGDQAGALARYREHLQHAAAHAVDLHYLVIGPWDHAGTRTPKAEFGGLRFGPASLLDLPALHRQWYFWTMQGGPKPDFLQKRVAYYVTGAEKWRYAESLESVTACLEPLHLQSNGSAADVFHSGVLVGPPQTEAGVDRYVFDPRDVGEAELESSIHPFSSWADQRMVLGSSGKQLVYHSGPFDRDVEIAGFFRLLVWLSIDQRDTAIRASIYEIDLNGGSIWLSADWLRARYRVSLREEHLIDTDVPLQYDFASFTFVARQMKKGHRLRLVIGPINSIYSEKNYNTGGMVAEESLQHARPVSVALHYGPEFLSALHVPFGTAEDSEDSVALAPIKSCSMLEATP